MKKFLGVTLKTNSKSQILEQIIKYIKSGTDFCHIVSLNPENMILVQQNDEFKKAIETAQIQIADGIGIVLAARILGFYSQTRLTGVELMEELIELAARMRLTVLLIGGKPNLALSLSKCYQEKHPEAKFFGIFGVANIQSALPTEEKKILTIVRQHKPHLIFVAFGSPWQELWLARHSNEFKGIVCMGVGQGFDVSAGLVDRAPVWIQKIGLEWLYRLFTQPWRWKRQLRLLQFSWMVIIEKMKTFFTHG